MQAALRKAACLAPLASGFFSLAVAQQTYSWQDVQARFRANNPSLKASEIGIDQAQAQEITAFLRPNPDLLLNADQFTFQPYNRPLAQVTQVGSISYLHERQHKRELRRDSARENTVITAEQARDLERTLLFNLRTAFVQALQSRAVLANAKENLAYYDRSLEVNRSRLQAGDIAEVDLDRLELQRVQFEADVENAEVSLRTAKIQLLTLLNDHTPVEKFDVSGPFDFSAQLPDLEEIRRMAMEGRPDLRAALDSIEKARTDHRLAVANGTADPTFSMDIGRNPPQQGYVGFGVSVPLRIFDRNQGEKQRTELEINRQARLFDATRAQVFSDVDSAYNTLAGTVQLLTPYRSKYLPRSVKVRDTVSYAYQRGGVSLLDFLDAQKSYRDTQLSYLNLVGSYLTAASQLNLSVGREVIP